MTPAQWDRVTALFDQARQLPVSERDAFLRGACDDEAVRTEVTSLLAADHDDAFLERGATVQPRDLLDEAGGPAYAAGDRVGPYVVERLLARGGMGVLYVARDPRLGRRVTLKVLPASATRDPRARVRLQREARTAALLRHPHIVSVHALEEIDDVLVIVAEYVEGPTLAEVLADRGPLPREEWLRVACALADALAAAHAAQVVHRDVKSRNVVLGRDGLRLVDFGIALADVDGGDTRVTRAGQFAGTPLAMAPEQLEGGAATASSDQYAFGLVLYEAASGRLPFGDGAIAGVWARMLRDEPTPLASVAPQLTVDDVVLVHRCLARKPEDRFPSMRAVHDALRAELDVPPGSRTPSPDSRIPSPESRIPSPEPRVSASRASHPTVGSGEGPQVRRSPERGWQGDNGGRSEEGPQVRRSPERRWQGEGGWWDIHQGVTATLYLVLLWSGWLVASALPVRWRATAHLTLVCLAAIATSLRLHLWFSARQYPRPVAVTRRRLWPVLTGVDVGYASLLAYLSAYASEARIVPAAITAGLAVCLIMASVVIEPATRRAERR